MIDYICLLLIGTNVLQFLFWSRHQHKLIDKIMARNYAEYAHYQGPKQTVNQQIATTNNEDLEDEVLREINSQIRI